ncbi:conserved Plasmodium protein, unknown function [Plasmodium malariae]|uniref:Uncharacterized protein n=1 Tax=Plasmodium malariae TaxID=5858 RepID=A0A1C3KEM7_PLAMA|nr:conserved Plasmodium protein, unknown function [Plasmodium malariae]
MQSQTRRVNATMRKCTEMDAMNRLYSIQLIEQRERIENLRRKLNSYNKNIEQQESIFNHLIKYTDGFLNNIIAFLENLTYTKKFNILTSCSRCYLVDDKDEINLVNNFNKASTCICKKIKSRKSVNNKCKNTIVYNKTSFYVEENTNRKKNKKNKNKYKKDLKKKYLQQNENIYNLHNPYDTVEVKELYNIYRKQSLSSCDNYYIN